MSAESEAARLRRIAESVQPQGNGELRGLFREVGQVQGAVAATLRDLEVVRTDLAGFRTDLAGALKDLARVPAMAERIARHGQRIDSLEARLREEPRRLDDSRALPIQSGEKPRPEEKVPATWPAFFYSRWFQVAGSIGAAVILLAALYGGRDLIADIVAVFRSTP